MVVKQKTLGEVADYYNGRAFKPIEWEETGLPIIRIQNLNAPQAKYNYSSVTHENKYLAHNGDLLFAWSASLGAFIWQGTDAWVNQHIFKVIPKPGTDKLYLYYFLLHVVDALYAKTHGSGMVHITLKPFKETPIPLPPLAEQRRIVERIERLFEKLDRAKELAQNALDSFETRKAAILHKAFTGGLTAHWREQNGVWVESWETKNLGELIKTGPQNGLYKPKTSYGEGTKIIRIDSFYDGYIEPWDTIKRLKLENSELDLYSLRPNDILINRVNSMPFLGKSALVRALPEECVFESNIMRLSLNEQALPAFIILYLNSSRGLAELRKNAKQAVNQASINQRDVKGVNIPKPSLPEQQEIVRILDGLFEKEQRARELCNVIDKIDLMKKAILARAFRGELGTNDPSEESAVGLLREVLK